MPTVKPNVQIGDKMRPMTDAEYEQWLSDNQAHLAHVEAQIAKAEAKVNVLDKLGLTADEAAALLG